MRYTILLLNFVLFGCINPGELSGTYQGNIIEANFLRQGFAAGTTITLTLEVENAKQATGSLSSSDGTFQNAPLAPLGSAFLDELGQVDLPGNNSVLLLLSAPDQENQEFFVLVSLGSAQGDTVRIAYGRDGEENTFYGVFPISRTIE